MTFLTAAVTMLGTLALMYVTIGTVALLVTQMRLMPRRRPGTWWPVEFQATVLLFAVVLTQLASRH